MKYLPSRVFNSPLLIAANFTDGTHINLIELKTPYANGQRYAIHDATPAANSRMFKSLTVARRVFDEQVQAVPVPLREVVHADHSKPCGHNTTTLTAKNWLYGLFK
jgi:hypothetical protein